MRHLAPHLRTLLLVLGVTAAAPAGAVVTAVRFQDLDLRDPHMWVSFLGCRDFTDTGLGGYSFNGSLQTRIQNDGDGDGRLDMSFLLLFDGLDPAAGAGSLRFGKADCSAPAASTACQPLAGETLTSLPTTQSSSGTCLGTIAGTLHPYTPAVTVATGPCFVTGAATLSLDVGDVLLTLHDARISGTFVGNPVTSIANGLLRGFLTEADANATIIPASIALIGGKPLSALLPGGDPAGPEVCCASFSDKDVNNGVPGWWFYLNYTGKVVPWSDPTVSVPAAESWPAGVRVNPNPARGRVEVSFALDRAADVRLAVYDLQGRQVAEVADGRLGAGAQRLVWDGRDADGRPASPGIYVLAMSRDGRISSRFVALVR